LGVVITLDRKPWEIELSPTDLRRDWWGDCNFQLRRIQVSPATKAKGLRREILIHEMIHAIFPRLDERIVRRAAREIDAGLQACGEKRWQPRRKAA